MKYTPSLISTPDEINSPENAFNGKTKKIASTTIKALISNHLFSII